jgi:hypothetical protein
MLRRSMTTLKPLAPTDRLLCGPGPSNVHPDVLATMRQPMNGHLDPDFWDLLLDLIDGLGALWRNSDGLSLCFSASGSSGMEAGITNLVEPGDKVLAIHSGFFGARIAEMARRHEADVQGADGPARADRSAGAGRRGAAGEPGHDARDRGSRRDLDRCPLPRAGARGAGSRDDPWKSVDGRRRDVARR